MKLKLEKDIMINEFLIEKGQIIECINIDEDRASRLKIKKMHDKGRNADGSIKRKGKKKDGGIDRRKSGVHKKAVTGKKKAYINKTKVKRVKVKKRSDREDKALGRK